MWNFLSIKFHKDQKTERTLCWHCKVKIMFFIISILTSTVPTGTLLNHWMPPLYRACSLASWLSERFSRKRKQWFSRPRLRLLNVAAYSDAKHRSSRSESPLGPVPWIKTVLIGHIGRRLTGKRSEQRCDERTLRVCYLSSGHRNAQRVYKHLMLLGRTKGISHTAFSARDVRCAFYFRYRLVKGDAHLSCLISVTFFCFNPFCGE